MFFEDPFKLPPFIKKKGNETRKKITSEEALLPKKHPLGIVQKKINDDISIQIKKSEQDDVFIGKRNSPETNYDIFKKRLRGLVHRWVPPHNSKAMMLLSKRLRDDKLSELTEVSDLTVRTPPSTIMEIVVNLSEPISSFLNVTINKRRTVRDLSQIVQKHIDTLPLDLRSSISTMRFELPSGEPIPLSSNLCSWQALTASFTTSIRSLAALPRASGWVPSLAEYPSFSPCFSSSLSRVLYLRR